MQSKLIIFLALAVSMLVVAEAIRTFHPATGYFFETARDSQSCQSIKREALVECAECCKSNGFNLHLFGNPGDAEYSNCICLKLDELESGM